MAISQDTYDAWMFENLKSSLTSRENEKQRNIQSTNGILETALTGNIALLQAATGNNVTNIQNMDIGEAAAISNVLRTEVSPQMLALGAAIRGFTDAIRTAQPPVTS